MIKDKEAFLLLKKTVKQTNEQGKQLEEVVGYMEEIYNGMSEMYVEVKQEIQELKDTRTLSDAQQYQIKDEIVHVVGKKFAKEFLGKDFHNLALKQKKVWYGKFYHRIWKKVRNRFSVARWYLIRRSDFEEAKEYILNLKLVDLDLNF